MVIENVPQIITKDGGYAKDRITEVFTERGYNEKMRTKGRCKMHERIQSLYL